MGDFWNLLFPQAVSLSINECDPGSLALDPVNAVAPAINSCSGTSDTVVYDLGSSINVTLPSRLPANFWDVIPTFLLPNQISNDTVDTVSEEVALTVGEFSLEVSDVEVLASFDIIPEVCLAGVCTPALVFPGFSSDEVLVEEGPLFEQPFVEISFSDDSVMDGNQEPWVLGGFGAATLPAFQLSPNLAPVVSITGSSAIGEGQTGFWVGDAEDPEGDINLTYAWNFGDGISATGKNASHAHVDNGIYTALLFVTDHSGSTGTGTFQVTVNNIAPSVNSGIDQMVNEGAPVHLGAFDSSFLGTNLISNPTGEKDATGNSGGWFEAGASDGSPIPHTGASFQRTPYRSTASVQVYSIWQDAFLLNTDGVVTPWGLGDFGTRATQAERSGC